MPSSFSPFLLLFFLFFLFSASSSLSSASPPKWHELNENYSFDQYIADFGKHYSTTDEYLSRRTTFEQNLLTILRHNSQHPSPSYRMGVNHMTDWTSSEFRSLLGYNKGLGHRQVAERDRKFQRGELPLPHFGGQRLIPSFVDWRDQGVLTAVKDQGQCGSCWSFAAAETVESHWAIATNALVTLSEQHILSCALNPLGCGGTGGCHGGTAELAFSALVQTGLASEWKYPYVSWYGDDFPCKYDPSRVGSAAQLSGYQLLPSNNYEMVLRALAFQGPLAINVDSSSWHHYESGIFDGCPMEHPDINHVVQLVGYGIENGVNYWVIRNSWTPNWGEGGFIRVLRDFPFVCGIDNRPMDGVVCEGGPLNVTVCGMCGVLYDVSFPKVKID